MNVQFKHRPDRDYKWEWYYSPQGKEFGEVYSWCRRTYGENSWRWDNHGGWIKFRDEADMILFVLRWSDEN